MRNILSIAVMASVLAPAYAGPLRDKLKDQSAERQTDELGDEDNGRGARGPFALPSGAQLERDVVYGSDRAQRMDVYRPSQAVGAPVIFMVHGGGWQHGDKDMHRVVKNKVAHWVTRGYLVISPNYRMLPNANPLVQADDVAKALAAAQSQAKAWGGDPARFVLMGHSAGAHLVSLIAADPSIATRQGAQPWLATVSLDSAAFDVVERMERRHPRLYDNAFKKDPAFWREASPTYRLKSAPAPMLIVCSSRRHDSCPQAKTFAAKVASLDGRADVLPVDLSHSEINDRLGVSGRYTASVDSFLQSLGLP